MLKQCCIYNYFTWWDNLVVKQIHFTRLTKGLFEFWKTWRIYSRQLFFHLESKCKLWEQRYFETLIWAASWQNQQNDYAPSEDSDQRSAWVSAKVWSESSLSAWRKLGSLATQWMHSEDWSDWANAQADESSLSARHFVGFVMRRLSYMLIKECNLKRLSGTIYNKAGQKQVAQNFKAAGSCKW